MKIYDTLILGLLSCTPEHNLFRLVDFRLELITDVQNFRVNMPHPNRLLRGAAEYVINYINPGPVKYQFRSQGKYPTDASPTATTSDPVVSAAMTTLSPDSTLSYTPEDP